MTLTTDDRGRLTGAGVFRPNTSFDVQPQPDGSVRVMELAEIPVVRPQRVGGRLRGAGVELKRDTVAAAVRAERDAR